MKAKEIKKDIYWVGALDPNLRVFDIIMYTPYGTTYNSYVVKGSEKTVVFETVKEKFFDEYVERLNSLNIDVTKIDYIIVDHTEPDHAGSVAKLLELSPKAKVVGSAPAIRFMNKIANRPFESMVVKDGDSIDLGNKTLKFITAPFLHWPDTIYTYLEEDGVIFTCDSFGSHYCNEEVFNDLNANEDNYMEALRYYFDCIMGPFKPYVLKAIDKIKDLDINTICTGHGPVLRENPWRIVDLYKQWSTPQETDAHAPKIVMPYVSAYGYTEELANKIAEGIHSVGDFTVNMYDMVHVKKDKILEDISDAQGLLFGSPTINGDALEPIMDLLLSLNPIVHGGKVAAAFGSFGWSGEAVPNIEDRLRQLRMVIVPGLKINFKPSTNDLDKAYTLGVNFASKIQEHLNKGSKPGKLSATKKWKCIVCNQVFEGPKPPEVCPACGAGADQFIEITEDVITYQVLSKEKFVIVGNGIAGYTAADAIRKRNKACDIEIISGENCLTYYRPMLSDLLSTDINATDFYVSPEDWYKQNNIKLTLGTFVKEIKSDENKLVLHDGREVSYNKLILANGSHNFVPQLKGADKENVLTLRDKNDADNIKAKFTQVKNAVVIGGGLLGLEAAWEMKQVGINVTVVELADRLLPVQLDVEGSAFVNKLINNNGVEILLGDSAEEILGDSKVSSVKLKSGKTIACDLVLFSVGIRPNSYLAKAANIATNKGVIVNEKMETNVADIYACGDVAELNSVIYGNWAAAMEMGRVAGMNSCGDEGEFVSFVSAFVLDALNVKLFSCGDINSRGKGLKQIAAIDSENGNYKKLFFKDDVIVGGILVGETNKSAALLSAISAEDIMSEVLSKDIL